MKTSFSYDLTKYGNGEPTVTEQIKTSDGVKTITTDANTGAVILADSVDPDSLNPVTAAAVADAVASASGEVPVIGDGDNGKVLKAVVDGSSKSVEWGDDSVDLVSNGGLEKNSSGAIGVKVDGETIVINQDGELQSNGGGGGGGTVDQTYNPTSTNAQSGTAVAGALASLPLNTFKAKYATGTKPYHIYEPNNKYIAVWKDTSSTDNVWWFLCGSYLNEAFKQDTNLLEILEANTPSVIYMEQMFSGCTSLTSVALFDTSNALYMGNMFNGCTSLTSVPLFDTSNVIYMGSMFSRCSSLTSVPLFNTSNVIDMNYMFERCTSLTTVPLLDTSKVTSMNNTFYGCTAVESGALALYNQASTQATPPTSHSGAFTSCGSQTASGAAELAQIPTSWGGTMA